MTYQDNSTQRPPLVPVRVGAHTYLAGTVYKDPHGWTWEAPSPESAARRVRRILAEAPYPPTAGDMFGRWGPLGIARPKRRRKPRLKTILDQAKKAGASSVTAEGVTYRFGEVIQSDTERELAAFEARHGNA
jgi:hypothetical protein